MRLSQFSAVAAAAVVINILVAACSSEFVSAPPAASADAGAGGEAPGVLDAMYDALEDAVADVTSGVVAMMDAADAHAGPPVAVVSPCSLFVPQDPQNPGGTNYVFAAATFEGASVDDLAGVHAFGHLAATDSPTYAPSTTHLSATVQLDADALELFVVCGSGLKDSPSLIFDEVRFVLFGG